ncbi:hypothetical protein EMCRGX_G021473 [Ephydatia muelleri]
MASRVHLLGFSIVFSLCFGYGLFFPLRRTDAGRGKSHLKAAVSCATCEVLVSYIQSELASNATLDSVKPAAIEFCNYALTKEGIYAPYVCPGIIDLYGPAVQYVATQVVLNPAELCVDFKLCTSNQTAHATRTRHLAPRELPAAPLPHATHNEGTRGHKADGGSTLTILQLTDIHIDPDYSEGSPTRCGLFVCCRSWYNGTGSAGHYGDYNCDLPITTLELLADTIKALDPQPDVIVYTGDNPPHDIWNETYNSQLGATQFLVDYLAQMLNRTIYPAMGNHESFPQSQYYGQLPLYKEVTQQLAQYWQKWVNFTDISMETVKRSACYSVVIPNTNLKLVSFNANYGYVANFYSYLNDVNVDYFLLLDWLELEVDSAEKTGQKVLIIAHVPPGDTSTHSSYGEFYLNLTKRYGSTIVGHLTGHTHNDEFQLAQDEYGVYGVVMVAPSVTPYTNNNPAFRIYTMDLIKDTLLGYDQYFLNLTKANEMAALKQVPSFELSYTTALEYGLQDLSPQSYAALIERQAISLQFEKYEDLISTYNYNKHSKSNEAYKNCDITCQRNILCAVQNIISSKLLECEAV